MQNFYFFHFFSFFCKNLMPYVNKKYFEKKIFEKNHTKNMKFFALKAASNFHFFWKTRFFHIFLAKNFYVHKTVAIFWNFKNREKTWKMTSKNRVFPPFVQVFWSKNDVFWPFLGHFWTIFQILEIFGFFWKRFLGRPWNRHQIWWKN